MTLEGDIPVDDLTARHAVAQGAHDAVADAIRYAALGVMALAVSALVFGPRGVQRILKRIGG